MGMSRERAKQKAVAAIKMVVEAAKELTKAEEVYFKSPSKSRQKGRKNVSNKKSCTKNGRRAQIRTGIFIKYPRCDSNAQPLAPEANALSN